MRIQHVVSYPISQGVLINIVAFVTVPGGEGTEHPEPAMIDVTKQEMLDQYKVWEPDLITLLDVRGPLLMFQLRSRLSFAVRGKDLPMGDISSEEATHLRGRARMPFGRFRMLPIFRMHSMPLKT